VLNAALDQLKDKCPVITVTQTEGGPLSILAPVSSVAFEFAREIKGARSTCGTRVSRTFEYRAEIKQSKRSIFRTPNARDTSRLDVPEEDGDPGRGEDVGRPARRAAATFADGAIWPLSLLIMPEISEAVRR
jgi:hypothetical protein